MYNSVIFSTASVSEWYAFAVIDSFLTGAPYSVGSTGPSYGLINEYDPNIVAAKLGRLRNLTSLTRLDNEACVAAYAANIVSTWSDLLLVSTLQNTNNSYLNLATQWQDPDLQVSGLCSLTPSPEQSCMDTGKPDPDNWALRGPDEPMVSYCMATEAAQHCKVQLSVPLMIAIIFCNIVKMICMWVIVCNDAHALVTVGDAIASFLDFPGQYSCMLHPKYYFSF